MPSKLMIENRSIDCSRGFSISYLEGCGVWGGTSPIQKKIK